MLLVGHVVFPRQVAANHSNEDGSRTKGSKGGETVAGGPVAAENVQKGQSKPTGYL